jgi:hypothetical protein
MIITQDVPMMTHSLIHAIAFTKLRRERLKEHTEIVHHNHPRGLLQQFQARFVKHKEENHEGAFLP